MNITKKIRHIIDSKVAAYIFKRYPMFIAFLRRYCEFMDENYTIEALNFENNLSADTIYERFIDEAWNQYCVNLIDRNEIEFTDDESGIDTKRLFLSLSKLLYQNKGKPFSFDIILRYLTEFYKSGISTVIDGVEYSLVEDETNWHSAIDYLTGNTLIPYKEPYTYKIYIDDEDKRIIEDLIEQYTPMGFWMIWVYNIIHDEIIDLSSSVDSLIYVPHTVYEEDIDFAVAPEQLIESLVIGNNPTFSESLAPLNLYDGSHDYDGDINYEASRGYALEEMDITYHHTTNPDIVESF